MSDSIVCPVSPPCFVNRSQLLRPSQANRHIRHWTWVSFSFSLIAFFSFLAFSIVTMSAWVSSGCMVMFVLVRGSLPVLLLFGRFCFYVSTLAWVLIMHELFWSQPREAKEYEANFGPTLGDMVMPPPYPGGPGPMGLSPNALVRFLPVFIYIPLLFLPAILDSHNVVDVCLQNVVPSTVVFSFAILERIAAKVERQSSGQSRKTILATETWTKHFIICYILSMLVAFVETWCVHRL